MSLVFCMLAEEMQEKIP